MSFEFITTEKRGHILLVTMNRPDVYNAVHVDMHIEMAQCWDDFAADPDLWVAVLTGAGDKAFCAGNDLKATAMGGNKKPMPDSGFAGLSSRFDLEKPIIAAVNGFALGGGLELALACHIRIASDNARMGLPEVSLGVIPGYGGTQRLPQIVGKGKAMEMILSAKMMGANDAAACGLVNAVVPPDALLETAHNMARSIMKNSPRAVATAIQAILAAYEDGINGFQEEINCFGASFETDDFKEGTQAFIEKRKPTFSGK